MQTLTFQNITLAPAKIDTQIWLTSSELAKALNYADSQSVTKIYERNQDEFKSSMSTVAEVQTKGGLQRVRIFSLRGCHLIAMFARTPVAKEFRKWVLDILDKEVGAPVVVTKTTTDDRTPLRQAVSLLVSRRGLDYSTAYTLVHQYMGVSHIDEIALADLPKAIDYVHSLIIKPVAHRDEFEMICHQATNQAMEYLHGLHAEIKRLGGTAPKLAIDEQALAQAVLTRMIQGKRLMVSLDYFADDLKAHLIDDQSYIVREDQIAGIIADPSGVSKAQLPEIMKAVLKRTGIEV